MKKNKQQGFYIEPEKEKIFVENLAKDLQGRYVGKINGIYVFEGRGKKGYIEVNKETFNIPNYVPVIFQYKEENYTSTINLHGNVFIAEESFFIRDMSYVYRENNGCYAVLGLNKYVEQESIEKCCKLVGDLYREMYYRDELKFF